MPLLKPRSLHKGDVIGLISPASTPSSSEKVEKSVRYLESLGYRTAVGTHVLDVNGYLAGSDRDRAEDFNAMVRDKHVKAIVALRGGYGTPRILPLLDYRAIRQHPKIIVGYSDLTALQLAVFKKTSLVTFSGPMAAVEMWDGIDPYTEEHFWRLVTSPRPVGILANPNDDPVAGHNGGTAAGRLLGGNLSLVVSSLATPYSPDYAKALLVLEEIDEAPHRVDRMVTQMFNGGLFKQLSGLVLGRFTDCVPSDPEKPNLTIDQVLADVLQRIQKPALSNLRYGHIPKKLTIPFGVRARLDAEKGRLEISEAAVR